MFAHTTTTTALATALTTVLALSLAAGCSDDAADSSTEADAAGDSATPDATAGDATTNDTAIAAKDYKATIRWTAHGIPHVIGDTLGDAAFGSGYAFATLNICTMADQLVKVNSKRAYWFGPGDSSKHIDDDFFHRFMRVRERAESGWGKLSDDSKSLFSGFVAGYNKYLADVGPSGLPKRCRDKAWVTPITELDALTYMNDLALVASSRALPFLGPVITHAQPPGKTAMLDGDEIFTPVHRFVDRIDRLSRTEQAWHSAQELGVGSNGWALGKDKTTTGKGMVLANPHFPWTGELKFWQVHVTVPGQYDVAGAALYGSPIPNIGFNESLAWTHTVSKSGKFTAYTLTLDPNDSTSYMYDGKPRKMDSRVETIQVKQPDGTFKDVSRTYYSSHYGPMLAIAGLGEWTDKQAYTIRDANASNLLMMDQFLNVGRAKSVAELEKVMSGTQANPWVNTIAADADGNAFYGESNSAPNLSADTYAAHAKVLEDPSNILHSLLYDYGFFVLDGSNSRDEWQAESGSRDPGLVPWAKTPHATRSDYVANANESYWLSNVGKPITGYARVFGKEDAVRSLRTRVTLAMIEEKGKVAPAGEDGKFTLDELKAVQFNNRTFGADLLLKDTLTMCDELVVLSSFVEGPSLAKGCDVLKKWDGRMQLDSKGAVLWREFLGAFRAALSEGLNYDEVMATPFDAKDVLGTPKGLKWKTSKGALNKVPDMLVAAVKRLEGQKIPVDATLGEWQFTLKDGVKKHVHGGLQVLGSFNIASWSGGRDSTLLPTDKRGSVLNSKTGLTKDGYVVNYGSSFIMAMGFTADGPKGVHLLTYSQSSEPDSPHFSDQTDRYAKAEWLALLYKTADIEADAGYKKQDVATK